MVFIIASMAAFSYLITPAYGDINDKRAEVRSRQSLKDDYEKSLDQIKQLKDKYQSVIESKNNISYILPPSHNTAEIVNQISNLAAVNRLTLDSLSVQRESVRGASNFRASNGVATLRFNVNISGTYENFRTYLGNLETNINLMDVSDLKIGVANVAGKGSSFSYTFTLDTYYQAN